MNIKDVRNCLHTQGVCSLHMQTVEIAYLNGENELSDKDVQLLQDWGKRQGQDCKDFVGGWRVRNYEAGC